MAKGLLAPGDKLPSVRELSMDLTLNHNTVAKAYQELEREGVIEVLRGRGTFVAEHPSPGNLQQRYEQLRRDLRRLAVEALHLQLTDPQVLEMLRDILADIHSGKGDAV